MSLPNFESSVNYGDAPTPGSNLNGFRPQGDQDMSAIMGNQEVDLTRNEENEEDFGSERPSQVSRCGQDFDRESMTSRETFKPQFRFQYLKNI
jgi:hypothetical protein